MGIYSPFYLIKNIIALLFLFSLFSNHLNAQSREDCLMCHQDPDLSTQRNGRNFSLFVNTSILDRSVHQDVDCALCHPDAAVSDYPHAENLAIVDCESCHDRPSRRFNAGIHGQAMKLGDTHAPNCKECHGKHDILHYTNPQSRTYKTNIPFLCGKCHKEGGSGFAKL